jgi:RNA polymerase sigma-70 factor (ECF subfamily)
MTDWILWRRACQGHKPSATALVHSLTPQAHGLAMQLLRKTEDAQDVVQESFLRLWSSQPTDGVGAKLSTFFNTIVINRCKSHLIRIRELSTGNDTLIDLADSQQQMAHPIEDDMAFSAAQLQLALGTLPARQRMALAMWAYADAQANDIAQALDIDVNAVHQLLFRAKASLRTALQGARL